LPRRGILDNYAHIGFAPKTRVMPASLAWVLKAVSADVATIYNNLGHAYFHQTKWPNVYTDAVIRTSPRS
jgi:hypothetical protein